MKTLTVPIFDMDVFLFTDREEAKVFAHEGSLDNPHDRVLETARGCYLTSYSCKRMLCIFDPITRIIAHECVHVANGVIGEVGIKTSPANDELHAYMVGWLVEEVLDLLDEESALTGEV